MNMHYMLVNIHVVSLYIMCSMQLKHLTHIMHAHVAFIGPCFRMGFTRQSVMLLTVNLSAYGNPILWHLLNF